MRYILVNIGSCNHHWGLVAFTWGHVDKYTIRLLGRHTVPYTTVLAQKYSDVTAATECFIGLNYTYTLLLYHWECFKKNAPISNYRPKTMLLFTVKLKLQVILGLWFYYWLNGCVLCNVHVRNVLSWKLVEWYRWIYIFWEHGLHEITTTSYINFLLPAREKLSCGTDALGVSPWLMVCYIT